MAGVGANPTFAAGAIQSAPRSACYDSTPVWDLAAGKLPDLTTGYQWELYHMEGVPGQIPASADHPSGSVTIIDAVDQTRRGWGTYVFAAQPQRPLSLSAPHLFDDAETQRVQYPGRCRLPLSPRSRKALINMHSNRRVLVSSVLQSRAGKRLIVFLR